MTATTEDLVARLRRNPDDTAAYSALKAHYHQQSDFASLANLVEGWARRCPDATAAARAFHEAGRLVEHYQSDHARAVSLFERALERDPHFKDAHRDLEHLLDAIGDPRLRVESLERRIASFTKAKVDARRIAVLRYKLGETWEHGFRRPDRAVTHYGAAMELDPTLIQAIYAARRIYQEAGNHAAAAGLLEQEATAEADRDRTLSLLRELAHLRAHQLDDLHGAIRAAEAALGVAPGHPHVMQDLAGYLARRASVSDPASAAVDVERAADVYFQLAEASRSQEALEHCMAALDLLPSHERALDLLEFLAHDNRCPEVLPARWVTFIQSAPDSPAVHKRRLLLADAYVQADQLEDAVYCLEPLLALGEAEAASRLADLYRQLGRTAEARVALATSVDALPAPERIARLHAMIVELESEGLRDEAVRRAETVLEMDGTDDEARRFLERAYREADDRPRLRGLYMRLGALEALPVAARAELYRRAASTSAEGDAAAAFEAWRALFELEPGADDAAHALREHLEAGARWDELAVVLERRALTLTDPAEKATHLYELAVLHQDRRGDDDEALRVLRSLRELAPRHAEARARLSRILLDRSAHEEVVPILRERIAEAEERATRRGLQHQLAEVLEDRAGDAEGAYRVCQQILDHEPGDLHAIERMERIDRQLRRYDRLMETLALRAEVVDPRDRPALLVQMAELAERTLGDIARAVALLREAVDMAPSETSARDHLRRLLAESNRHEELVRLLHELLETERDRTRRVALLRELARILSGALGDAEGAAEAYRRLLEEAGDDEEAVEVLLEHAQRSGDHEAWVELASRRMAHVTDPSALLDLRLARADVLVSALGHLNEGARALEEALESAPDHVPALERLAAIHEGLGEHAQLAATLERHLAIASDAMTKARLAQRLVALHEGPLADLEAAIRHAYAWAEHAPGTAEPLDRLAALLERTGRHEALLGILDALAALLPARAHDHALRAARICVEALGDPDAALARLEARLEQGDEAVWPTLRETALAHGRAHALADLLARRAERAEPSAEALALWESAAEVLRDHAEDPAAALSAMLRAFALAPRDTKVLERLEASAALANDFDRLVAAYGHLVGLDLEEGERVRLLVRLADVLERRARDPGRALEPITAACARHPEQDDLFARAEALAASAGRHDALLAIYERRATTASGERRFTALLRSAELASEGALDVERAAGHLLHAAEMGAADPRALARVEEVAQQLDARHAGGGDPFRTRLATLYRTMIERREAGAVRSGLLRRAARLLGDDLARPQQAYELLRRAYEADASDATLFGTLHAHARGAGALEDLASLLDKLVDEALDAHTAARLLRHRGDLLRDELGRASEAADVYQRLAMLARDDVSARRALFHALQAAGRHEDLAMALERELRTSSSLAPEERLALRRVVAKTWEGPLHNRYEALDAWSKVLREAGDDAEAQESVARLKSGGQLRSTTPPPFELPLGAEPFDEPEIASGEVRREDLRAPEPISDVLLLDDLAVEPLDSGEVALEAPFDEPTLPSAPMPPFEPSSPRRSVPPPAPRVAGATRSIPPPPPPPRSSRPEAPRVADLVDVADFVDELDLASSESARVPRADDSVEELDPELDLLEEEGEPT